MKMLKFLVIFMVFKLNFGYQNVFYERLNKLLDYCLSHPESVDHGTILGVIFAKHELQWTLEKTQELDEFLLKCETLEKNFLIKNRIPNTAEGIGEHFI